MHAILFKEIFMLGKRGVTGAAEKKVLTGVAAVIWTDPSFMAVRTMVVEEGGCDGEDDDGEEDGGGGLAGEDGRWGKRRL